MLEILAPGMLATVQDTGRHGVRWLGIGTAGAMDVFAARVANALLGNQDSAPVLELCLGGVEILVHESAWFALCGADLAAGGDGEPLPLCAPVRIDAGQVLRLPRALSGCRAVLAVAGGFAAQAVLGSAATDLRGGFGGCAGRALQRGDRIAYRAAREPRRLPPPACTSLAHPGHRVHDAPLMLVPGTALALLDPADRARLLEQGLTVSRASDRMGLRVEESLPSAAGLPEQLSHAVGFGAVQLPPAGKAIILGADCQTTGGYPLAGVVAGVDHWRIAQARPAQRLRFRVVDVVEVQAAWRVREAHIARLRIAAAAWWREG